MEEQAELTVLVQDQDVATIEVDGMRSAEAGKATADNNDTRWGHLKVFCGYRWHGKKVLMSALTGKDERKNSVGRTRGQ